MVAAITGYISEDGFKNMHLLIYSKKNYIFMNLYKNSYGLNLLHLLKRNT